MQSWKTRLLLAALLASFGCDGPAGPKDELSSLSLGLGDAFETRTVTHLEAVAVEDMITTTHHRIVAQTQSEASLALDVRAADGTTDSTRINVPLKVPLQDPEECPGLTVETATEICAVPAGTFECTRQTVEYRQGDVVRSVVTWTTPGLPVPVRSLVKNENLTTLTELTRVTPAR